MEEFIEKMFINPAFVNEDNYQSLKSKIIIMFANFLKINNLKKLDDIEKPLEKKINLIELSDDIRLPISKIPKINKKFTCKKCGKIPKIKKYQEVFFEIDLAIECHNESIKLGCILDAHFEEIPNYLGLTDIKDNPSNDDNKNENEIILPFKNLNDLSDFFLYVLLYNIIKDRIKEYNYGETKNNMAFTLFENLLSNALYNKNEEENEICFNNLSIFKKTKYNFFAIYNKIKVLSNGTKFHFKMRKKIPIKKHLYEIYSPSRNYDIYKLYNNLYCFMLDDNAMIIKGNLEEINFEENNDNVIYLDYFHLSKNKIEIENFFKIKLFYMLKKRNIIYIKEDLFLGTYDGYLFLINLKDISLDSDKLDLNDKILLTISLENKNIKPIKNKNAFQFLLIGSRYIFLMEYLIEQKKYEKIKEYKYFDDFDDEKYDNSKCYLIQNDKLIFSIDKNMFFFNLNTFQLITIIHLEDDCPFIKLNENYIICNSSTCPDLISLNNLKMKFIEFPCEGVPELIIDERYLFAHFWIYDLKTKEITIYHEKNIPIIGKYNYRRKMFSTSEKEFFIYYIYEKEDGKFNSFIDFYIIE